MAIATLSRIQKAIGAGARPNQFRVTMSGGINATGESQLSFLTKAAALPNSTLGLIEVPHVGGRRLKLAGDRTFSEWTTTVLNDSEFNVRDQLELYQKRFVNTFQNSGTIGNRKNQALTTITVEQLDISGRRILAFQLRDCFISEVGAIDLSYDSTDTIEEFPVTWVYSYYQVKGTL